MTVSRVNAQSIKVQILQLAFVLEQNPDINSLVLKSCEELNGEFLLDLGYHDFEYVPCIFLYT